MKRRVNKIDVRVMFRHLHMWNHYVVSTVVVISVDIEENHVCSSNR